MKRLDVGGKKFIKSKDDISYEWFDFFKVYTANENELLANMQKYGSTYLKDVKPTFLNFGLSSGQVVQSQKGVLRVNCVDCLDRTNNAMACIASVVSAEMLRLMNIDFKLFFAETTQSVCNELMQIVLNMFGSNGDRIAQQYAGSDAFHKAQIVKTESGKWQTLKQNIVMIAVKRYISNTLMDNEKQRNIWLFLGDFTPEKEPTKEVWEVDPAEKESEEILYKNALTNYISTVTEKLPITDGRLRRIFLIELRGLNGILNANFNKYYEQEIEFDQEIDLTPNQLPTKTNNHEDVDDLPSEDYAEAHLILGQHPSSRIVNNSKEYVLFKSLKDLSYYYSVEESIFATNNPIAKPSKKA